MCPQKLPLRSKTPNLAAILAAVIAGKSEQHANAFYHNFINRHTGWVKGTLPKIDPVDQIKEINSYWRIQLGVVRTDTTKCRSCIIDGIDVRDWIHNYEVYVVDTIISIPIGELTYLWGNPGSGGEYLSV